jgi:roadblock/LC7 domain-containing protein
VIAALASQQTTAQMMSIFATQQARIKKDAELIAHAKGGAAAEDFQKNDPKVIAKSIGAQLDNTLANTTAPMMPAVNQGMNWLASGLAYTAEHGKTRPGDIVAGGGWLAAMSGALGLDGLGKTAEFFTGKGGSLGLSRPSQRWRLCSRSRKSPTPRSMRTTLTGSSGMRQGHAIGSISLSTSTTPTRPPAFTAILISRPT